MPQETESHQAATALHAAIFVSARNQANIDFLLYVAVYRCLSQWGLHAVPQHAQQQL